MRDNGLTHTIDATAIGIAFGSFIDALPSIAAGLSVIWMLLRIYETWQNIRAQNKGDKNE